MRRARLWDPAWQHVQPHPLPATASPESQWVAERSPGSGPAASSPLTRQEAGEMCHRGQARSQLPRGLGTILEFSRDREEWWEGCPPRAPPGDRATSFQVSLEEGSLRLGGKAGAICTQTRYPASVPPLPHFSLWRLREVGTKFINSASGTVNTVQVTLWHGGHLRGRGSWAGAARGAGGWLGPSAGAPRTSALPQPSSGAPPHPGKQEGGRLQCARKMEEGAKSNTPWQESVSDSPQLRSPDLGA